MLSSLFCALITVGAYTKIPFYVPVTLQLLFVNTAALLLKRKWGFITALSYIALGVIGLPVFSFGGGFGCFLSLSFGFTLGFVPGAFLAGWISEKHTDTKGAVVASLVNVLCVYLCGTVYFLMIKNFYFSEPSSLSYALSVCVLPFVLPDIVKISISILLYKKLKRHIKNKKPI